MENKKIGQFIKQRRKELNLSQIDLANFLSVTVPTISKWENDERIPDIAIFSSLSKILKVDLESLLKGEATLNNLYDVENNFNINDFSKHFSYLRKFNNFTLQSLANGLDVSYQTISKRENGESAPNIYVLANCARIFKVSLAELYYGKKFEEVKIEVKKNKKNKNLIFTIAGALFLVAVVVCANIPLMIKNDSSDPPTQTTQPPIDSTSTESKPSTSEPYEDISDFTYNIKSDDTVILNEYHGNSIEVVIPSQIKHENNFYKVSEVTFGLLKDCTNIRKLTLPFIGQSISSTENDHLGFLFGGESFEFNSIAVPATLKDLIIVDMVVISKRAFSGCSNIESIILPDNLESIEEDAFLGCTNLKYNESEEIRYLGTKDNSYYALISVKNPDQNEYLINERAIMVCPRAFTNCHVMESLTLPRSFKYFCENAFAAFRNLKAVYYNGTIADWMNIKFENFRSSPLYYNARDFYYLNESNEYTLLKHLEIPNTISDIKSFVFDGFDCIESIYIGDDVLSIREKAFAYCSSLESIFIPKSVLKMEQNVFYGINGIKIYCEAESKPIGWHDDYLSSNNSFEIFYGCVRN